MGLYRTEISSEQMTFTLEQGGHARAGAFIPYTTSPSPSIVVMTDTSSSQYGTPWEHSPEAGELHMCPWLLSVPLQGLHGIFREPSLGQRDPRGDCVMVSIPWWITIHHSMMQRQFGGSLRKAAAMQHHSLLPVRVQSPAAPDLLQGTCG